MHEDAGKQRLDTQALIIGYAMSRLTDYASRRGLDSWESAYNEAAEILGVKARSLKLLRDEFDPFNDNGRRGYWKRPPRPSRQRILDELSGMSDPAVYELVLRILARDEVNIAEALDSLVTTSGVPNNVAERLLTGRRAEEYFIEHAFSITRIKSARLIDRRNDAAGYDFGVIDDAALAIEIKGIKKTTGGLLFTDNEWRLANQRKKDYWLVVVGNLEAVPVARLYKDPASQFSATCHFQQTVSASWQFRVSLGQE